MTEQEWSDEDCADIGMSTEEFNRIDKHLSNVEAAELRSLMEDLRESIDARCASI